jgi:DNA-binding NarL/FixJ family response regulator
VTSAVQQISQTTSLPADLAGVRAVVAEGVEVLRTGIVQTLRRLGVAVVVETGTAANVAAAVLATGADLVVVGDHLEQRVSTVVATVKSAAPACRIAHLATTTDRAEYVALLKSGAEAIVPLTSTAADLGRTLERLVRGERVFAGTALAAVRADLVEDDRGVPVLSARERQVLGQLATRRTLASIAGELYVSLATVKTHAGRIYGKLDAHGREEAVERAVALGLLG